MSDTPRTDAALEGSDTVTAQLKEVASVSRDLELELAAKSEALEKAEARIKELQKTIDELPLFMV